MTHGSMIREILVAGGLVLAWMVAALPLLLLTPWAGALFAAGLSVLPVVVHVWIPRRKGRTHLLAALRARPLAGRWNWILAALALTPVWAISLAIGYNQLIAIPEEAPDIFFAYAAQEGGWIALAILVVIFGPIVEEFALRGWIQGSLERRFSPAVAIFVSAFLYAIVHGSAEVLILFFIIGALFGWAVWQSGSIWAGILLHSSYNATMLVADALWEAGVAPASLDPDAVLSAVGLVLLFVVFATAIAGVVFLGRRAGRTTDPRLARETTSGVGS